MHRVTSRSKRWQNYRNCFSNCFRNHPILKIWPPSNYWLFTDLKRMLLGKRFDFNKEIISEIEVYFETKDKLFYKKDIELYHPRRRICWRIKYFETKDKLFYKKCIELYHPRRRLCWRIKSNFDKKLFYQLRPGLAYSLKKWNSVYDILKLTFFCI